MSSAASLACTSEIVMIKSGFNLVISFRFAELNPLTRGFGGVPSGWLKYAVTPATISHAPMRRCAKANPLLQRKDRQYVVGFGSSPKQEAHLVNSSQSSGNQLSYVSGLVGSSEIESL